MQSTNIVYEYKVVNIMCITYKNVNITTFLKKLTCNIEMCSHSPGPQERPRCRHVRRPGLRSGTGVGGWARVGRLDPGLARHGLQRRLCESRHHPGWDAAAVFRVDERPQGAYKIMMLTCNIKC